MLRSEAKIGELVEYCSRSGNETYGWITSTNEIYAFVRFVGELHSKAVRYKDIIYVDDKKG